jgi:hypothetical protein
VRNWGVARVKCHIHKRGDQLQLTIPSRSSRLTILLLPICLATWTFGAAALIISLFSQTILSFGAAVLCLWILGWFALGAGLLHRFLRFYAGRETIIFTPTEISIQRNILGIPFAKRYSSSKASDFRVSDQSGYSDWFGGGFSPVAHLNCISFAYAGRTVRFAVGINENEASQFIAELGKNNLAGR